MGGINPPNFKTYYAVIEIKVAWYCQKIHKQINEAE
jgi:hypothetical protein